MSPVSPFFSDKMPMLSPIISYLVTSESPHSLIPQKSTAATAYMELNLKGNPDRAGGTINTVETLNVVRFKGGIGDPNQYCGVCCLLFTTFM